MNIGIIGSGVVGQVLAKAFISEGHTVMLGTRNKEKEEVVNFKNNNKAVAIGNFEETAKFGSLLVLAVNGAAATEAVRLAGYENFTNKIVLDTTNPIAAVPPANGVLNFFTSMNESLMEQIQTIIPSAKLVKAFNSVGNAFMYKPAFREGKPTMFICGNDDAAKKIVTDILTAFEWETEDMGKAESARAIEPLCMLWCIPGLLHHQWTHAFKLLKA
jgi:8-hydroxy-5-deazaflavin:NADPH oxidoreductase